MPGGLITAVIQSTVFSFISSSFCRTSFYFSPVSCIALARDLVFWYMVTYLFSALRSKYFASEVTTWTAFQPVENLHPF